MTKYPRVGKGKDMQEPGKDIWDAFRPCYIRAFKDAADWSYDDGTTISGTKSAKQDDFVSIDEFRVFNAYVVIYAAIFDAFAQIDGGGAGRDAGDDKRIELHEWLAGYEGLAGLYGFVATQDLAGKSKRGATSIFQKMDDNGGGIVLLEEFATYVKAREIEEDTTLGKCLNEEQAPPTPEELEAKRLEQEAKDAAAREKRDKVILQTSFGLKLCRGVSKELRQFIEVFAPMAEKTEEAEEARKEGFVLADP
jgi:hypothetical protein